MIQFADTFYFLALLNRKDSAHAVAFEHSYGPGRILTTEWVLTELADAMASRVKRQEFISLLGVLRTDPQAEIVPCSAELFADGIELYAAERQGLVAHGLYFFHRYESSRHRGCSDRRSSF